MITTVEIAERLLLAAFLGGVIGFDRERHEWSAGLRTHMLVAVGAALAIIVSAYGFGSVLEDNRVILDPSRIAAQVVSGIGFLGAGTIMFLQREHIIRGLTTAAGLWAVAAIGLAAGSGMYWAAIGATVIVLVIIAILKPLERLIFGKRVILPRMSLTIAPDVGLGPIRHAVNAQGLALRRLALSHDGNAERERLDLEFEQGATDREMAHLADDLRRLPGISSIAFGADAGTPDDWQ